MINEVPKDKFKLAYLAAAAVMFIIVVIAITSFFIGKNEGVSTDSPIPVINIASTSPEAPKVLGAKTYTLTGTIKNIENSEIQLLETETQDSIGIKISEYTTLYSWDLTKPPSIEDPNSGKEFITSAELKIGDKIIIKSSTPENSAKEIEAQSIGLLITPASP